MRFSLINVDLLLMSMIACISLSNGNNSSFVQPPTATSILSPSHSFPSTSSPTSPTPSPYPCLSKGMVCKMRTAIRDYYLSLQTSPLNRIQSDFLGGVVRLSFHDAGTYSLTAKNGGPDGCVDYNDPDNAGLQEVADEVEKLYTPFKNRLSRADFWALTAIEAVSISQGPSMNFRYGRKDCNGNLTADHGRLPSAEKDYAHIFDVFGTRMGFTDREITALLGAHTLGACDPKNSGFDGPWTLSNSPAVFDNQYYLGLLVTWIKVQNNFPGKGTTFQWQQVAQSNPAQMFLTADMDLLFTNADAVGCDNSQMYEMLANPPPKGTVREMIIEDTDCNLNNRTFFIVEEYADNQAIFHSDFSQAFQKLQEIGYPSGSLLSPGECKSGILLSTDPTCPPTAAPNPAPTPTSSSPNVLSYSSNVVWTTITFLFIELMS